MQDFIDTSAWPLVRLTMPEKVEDESANIYMRQMEALYDRASPFVLIMAGAEIPRHSPRFMNAYGAWSRENSELQRLYCIGAVRVEPDPVLRNAYQARATQAAKAGVQPYAYVVVETECAAQRLAHEWFVNAGLAIADRVSA